MSVLTDHPPPKAAELVPRLYDPALIVGDNAALDQAIVAALVASYQTDDQGQLNPGWLFPAPELPEPQRMVLEGHHRLEACRLTGRMFLAFDLGRFVPEEERIRLTFTHNKNRRIFSREEVAQRAARWMEITGGTQHDAATQLGISAPTLSRCFGLRRLPLAAKARTDRLPLSIQSLIAALPEHLMEKAIAFAETPLPDGKKPIRDQVYVYLRQLRKSGKPKGQRPKSITLRAGNRKLSLGVTDGDSAATLAEDLKTIVAKLAKHADVPIDGLPFLFQ